MNEVRIRFPHGLGDCANFAQQVPMYRARGYDVRVDCDPDKAFVFRSAGAVVEAQPAARAHDWWDVWLEPGEAPGRAWEYCKPLRGAVDEGHPVPRLAADPEAVYAEYAATRVDAAAHLSNDARDVAAAFLAGLPRPLVLLHAKGNTGKDKKDMPDGMPERLAAGLVNAGCGVVFLEWDRRVAGFNSAKVKHAGLHWRREGANGPSVEDLVALIDAADLLVGVDSGPLHLARMTRTPRVGVWFRSHPISYTLPAPDQLNVMAGGEDFAAANLISRASLNIVEANGTGEILQHVLAVLEPRRRFAPEPCADAVLRHYVSRTDGGLQDKWGRTLVDRHSTFGRVLQMIGDAPRIVETGCIRGAEDWRGAGYWTYLAGLFLHKRGGRGRLDSVDLSDEHVRFARAHTPEFSKHVTVHQRDSVDFLRGFAARIDLLYLDSLDTDEPGHAEHALAEVKAAEPRLHGGSLVLFDDTPWGGDGWIGKGAKAIPYLESRGWKILESGYQALLAKAQ